LEFPNSLLPRDGHHFLTPGIPILRYHRNQARHHRQAADAQIDTAQDYDHEPEIGVGRAVRQSGLKRADVFITTKILTAGGSSAKSVQKGLDSVEKIDGTDGYVDCFLIHSPNGGKETRAEIWQALETLYEIGKAKSIGVSNFGIGHIEEMKTYATVWPPHVNQIQACSASLNSCKACGHWVWC
jgi:diketogulonate reductase-like aldo/keto reductase